jgi:hypothetical protein
MLQVIRGFLCFAGGGENRSPVLFQNGQPVANISGASSELGSERISRSAHKNDAEIWAIYPDGQEKRKKMCSLRSCDLPVTENSLSQALSAKWFIIRGGTSYREVRAQPSARHLLMLVIGEIVVFPFIAARFWYDESVHACAIAVKPNV